MVLTEGSYQELQESTLDFTKLLGSSPEATSESESESISNKNTVVDNLNSRSPYERQISSQSIISSVNEYKFNENLTTTFSQEIPGEEKETRTYGSVSSNVYTTYFSAGGSIIKMSFFIFICIFTQVLSSGGDYWMTYWYYALMC